MKRFMTEVYSRTVDKVTPLHVGGLRINRWEIELTVDAIKHDKKHYLLKLSPNQNGVKYLCLLFLSLGEVAMNLRKPPWRRFSHIYVLYVTKAQCTYCWGNDTMSCNRPFYSYGWKRGWGDLVLVQTFLLYYVNQVILMLTSIFQGQFPSQSKGVFYQNKVTVSLTFTRRLGY